MRKHALAGSLLLAAAVLIAAASFAGGVTRHMLAHIAVMNALAPALALYIRSKTLGLAPAAALQILALLAAHSPTAMALVETGAGGVLALNAALLAVAWLFWSAALSARGADRWQAILALLVTGKIYCLFAAVLVFSPRALFAHHGGPPMLADQHLAGLLMISACSLTYVSAGVALTVRWLDELRLASPSYEKAR